MNDDLAKGTIPKEEGLAIEARLPGEQELYQNLQDRTAHRVRLDKRFDPDVLC